jgi:hypothetical protein
VAGWRGEWCFAAVAEPPFAGEDWYALVGVVECPSGEVTGVWLLSAVRCRILSNQLTFLSSPGPGFTSGACRFLALAHQRRVWFLVFGPWIVSTHRSPGGVGSGSAHDVL